MRPRSIKGSDLANVYTTTQILSGEVVLKGKKVALIGSGMTGLETAEMLIDGDNKVTIVEMADTLAPGTWFQHLDDVVPKLDAKDTNYILSHRLVSIDEKGVTLEPVKLDKNKNVKATDKPAHFNFDVVVLSLGARPVNDLAKAIEGKFENIFVIGDAKKVGRIADATSQAYDVAIHKIK